MRSLIPAGLLLTSLLLSSGAYATQAEHVRASHAWIRLLPGALPAGGYVTLLNDSAQPASLIGASSTAYDDVMLHQSMGQQTGMSRMMTVDHLELPAHGQVALAPAGYHLMLEKATHPLQVGDTIKVTLHFADGSVLDTDFLARPANTVDAN
jgi:copper(I)-binding protein